jgi:CysZ protein
VFASARKAARILFDPAFIGVVLKALALTVVLFALLLAGCEYGIHRLIASHPNWPSGLLAMLGTIFLLLLIYLLGAPIAAFFAAIFFDDIAEAVENRCYSADPPAPGAPFWRSFTTGLRLFGLTLVLALLLFPLNLLMPGVGAALSLMVSGWLLGREYFELAALRHIPLKSAASLWRRHSLTLFSGGLLVAVLAAIPFIDLVAPVFGVALMVHEFKRLTKGSTNEVA